MSNFGISPGPQRHTLTRQESGINNAISGSIITTCLFSPICHCADLLSWNTPATRTAFPPPISSPRTNPLSSQWENVLNFFKTQAHKNGAIVDADNFYEVVKAMPYTILVQIIVQYISASMRLAAKQDEWLALRHSLLIQTPIMEDRKMGPEPREI